MNYKEEFEAHLLEEGKGKRTIEEYVHTIQMLVSCFEERTGNEFDCEEVTALNLHN